jgi:hypothetical protein
MVGCLRENKEAAKLMLRRSLEGLNSQRVIVISDGAQRLTH